MDKNVLTIILAEGTTTKEADKMIHIMLNSLPKEYIDKVTACNYQTTVMSLEQPLENGEEVDER